MQVVPPGQMRWLVPNDRTMQESVIDDFSSTVAHTDGVFEVPAAVRKLIRRSSTLWHFCTAALPKTGRGLEQSQVRGVRVCGCGGVAQIDVVEEARTRGLKQTWLTQVGHSSILGPVKSEVKWVLEDHSRFGVRQDKIGVKGKVRNKRFVTSIKPRKRLRVVIDTIWKAVVAIDAVHENG